MPYDERDRPLGRDQHCLQGCIAAAVDVHRRARAEGEEARRGGDALLVDLLHPGGDKPQLPHRVTAARRGEGTARRRGSVPRARLPRILLSELAYKRSWRWHPRRPPEPKFQVILAFFDAIFS